jgi:hypothetical protein
VAGEVTPWCRSTMDFIFHLISQKKAMRANDDGGE